MAFTSTGEHNDLYSTLHQLAAEDLTDGQWSPLSTLIKIKDSISNDKDLREGLDTPAASLLDVD